MKKISLPLLLVLLNISLYAKANNPISAEVFYNHQKLEHKFSAFDDTSLNLGVVGVSLGYQFTDNIALVYKIGTGVFDDEMYAFKFKTQLYTSLQLASKYHLSDALYLYGAAGAGLNKVNQKSGGNINIKGLTTEFGAGYQLNRVTDIKVTWEKIFNNTTYDGADVELSSLNISLSYNF
ncbi:MAG: outer membrane beta-barrel protein [Cognaticolwellia sp.]